MITLHRLSHDDECFQLNPDLIVSIESTPDTVITLATAAKIVVADTPEQVMAAVRHWRAGVLAAALAEGAPADELAPPIAGAPRRVLATVQRAP
jgi:flagellar protein FlbD